MSGTLRSPAQRAPARRGRWLLAIAVLCCTGCRDAPLQVEARQRQGQLGSLRDLVLFDRPGLPPSQALFIDRFEVTRADWAEFAITAAGRAVGGEAVLVSGDAALPVAGIDLRQARAFASWRGLRLPSRAEWELATTGEAHSKYPWGDRPDASRANTGELGLLMTTPVGTFESGRRAGGNQPYDLIGNVSEWTETVPPRWFQDERDSLAAMRPLRDDLLRCRALSVWTMASGLMPPVWLVQAGGARVPRDVVGSDFQAPMETLVESVPAGDRRERTGLRLYGTAADLVASLLARSGEPTAVEMDQLRAFVRRPGHRDVLAAAFREVARNPHSGFGAVLAVELGEVGGTPR